MDIKYKEKPGNQNVGRQKLHRVEFTYLLTNRFTGALMAVSYTHLDVYKRQAKILFNVIKSKMFTLTIRT